MAAAAAAGVAVGAFLARARRRGRTAPAEEPDPRAEELRRKLAEARTASDEEEEFHAAGMGAETMVEEPARPAPPAAEPDAAAAEPRPPSDEFEAMRRRIHEEGRAAAEEMRRGSEPGAP